MAEQRPANSRILVIHTAFIGDIILATPFLRALREKFPLAEIRFLTTDAGVALLTPNPWGIEPLAFRKRTDDSGLRGFLRKAVELRAFRPDLVFSLHRSLRSTLLAKFAGGESWGFREAAGAFFFHGRASRAGIAHEAEKNLAVLRAKVAGEFSPYPELRASPADEAAATALLGDQKKFVVLAPSSVWATKRWPPERFGQLAELLRREFGLSAVIVGGDSPEDRAAGEAALSAAPESLNLSGKTNLGSLKAILARAELVIANDSSPLHMATAMGTKAVGIFGPTTRDLGFFPLAPPGRAAATELVGLECRPCGLHGHQKCPLGHFRCMLDLRTEQVYAETKKLLCP